jgi:site-specific DNA-methyltransferase (adenine-specific)
MKPYYDEDGITIYHGDAQELLSEIPRIELLVTDPPYFQPVDHAVPARGMEGFRTLGDFSVLEYWFKEWADKASRNMADWATAYIFCDGRSYPSIFRAWHPHAKVRTLIWDKGRGFNGYTWRYSHELIAWARMPNAEQIPTAEGDVLRMDRVPTADRLHNAQKPVPLLQRLIAKHEGAAVTDPFMGSGSTLVAAKQLGRRAVGIEIEERYCEIAVQRLAQGVLELNQ